MFEIEPVLVAVEASFLVRRSEIFGRRKDARCTYARFALCCLLFEHGLSYKAIGRRLKRDHSSIINAVRRGKGLETSDLNFSVRIKKARELACAGVAEAKRVAPVPQPPDPKKPVKRGPMSYKREGDSREQTLMRAQVEQASEKFALLLRGEFGA